MQINDIDLDTGKVNVTEYKKADAAISELRQRYGDISAIDPDTDEGYSELKAGIKEVSGYRTKLEAKRKEIKAPFLQAGKIIDAEAKRITAALVELEDPMKAKKAVRDEREKREKAERIDRLQQKVDDLKAYADRARGKSSGEIARLIDELDEIDTERDFYDLTTEACVAKLETLEKLSETYTERLSFERAEADRQEQERINRELRAQQEREQKLNAIRNAPMDVFGKTSAVIREKRNELIIERDRLADAIELDEPLWNIYQQSIDILTTMVQQAEHFEATASKHELIDSQPVIDSHASGINAMINDAVTTGAGFMTPEKGRIAPEDFYQQPEMVTITRQEYKDLLAESRMLAALVDAGVDNWPGYSDAYSAAHAEEDFPF